MAGSKLIRASSLLEVMISMVLVLIVFGLAMMISANVMRSSLSVKKLRAQGILREILVKAEQSADNQTATTTVGDFEVSQSVKPYNNSINLTEVRLAALDNNRDTVAYLQKIILSK
jgi:Tfp pilus assembly protein PilV